MTTKKMVQCGVSTQLWSSEPIVEIQIRYDDDTEISLTLRPNEAMGLAENIRETLKNKNLLQAH